MSNYICDHKIKEPIIKSFLDDDWYKFLLGNIVFKEFKNHHAAYEFFNRGNTSFPEGFIDELSHQICLLKDLSLTEDEAKWLSQFFSPEYIEYLKNYRYNPSQITIFQSDGDLKLYIKGPWIETLFWEVKLMAIISELYFRLMKYDIQHPWMTKCINKIQTLTNNNCKWMEFGTRRRYSYGIQEGVLELIKYHKDYYREKCGFQGSSNVYFSYKYNTIPIGTYPHEAIMAMSALYGVRAADIAWRKTWIRNYSKDNLICLTDTFTTNFFLKNLNKIDIHDCAGLRQDSGNPYLWAYKINNYYYALGISLEEMNKKKFVFSDSLCVDDSNTLTIKNNYNYIEIHRRLNKYGFNTYAGIGTHFTNDVFSEDQINKGIKPLNMVIKMVNLNDIPVVKLSDNEGKHSGDKQEIERIKEEISL